MPLVRTVWRTSTASNQPQRRGRPVTVPNSRPRSPMQVADLVRSARSGTALPLPGSCRPCRYRARSRSRRAQARAGRRLGRHRVGGGHERIGAVVDVEQRALGALEQDPLALAPLLVEQRPHRIHVGQHPRRDALELVLDRCRVDLLESEPAPQRVVMRQQPLDLAPERRQVGEVHHPDGAPADLVLISRADAAPGGADAGQRARRFANGVELADAAAGSAWRSRRSAGFAA